ncbi:MAG: CocE/NonD family hydrolase [Acidimicrobiales bacterium]
MQQRGRRLASIVAVGCAVVVLAAGCSSSDGSDGSSPSSSGAPTEKATGRYATDLGLTVDDGQDTAPATFHVRPGTEEVTITGVDPKDRLSLVDAEGHRLVVMKADKYGQVHIAYLPNQLGEFQTGGRNVLPTTDGYTVKPGNGYTVRNESTDPVQVSKPFTVGAIGDHPQASFYDRQAGKVGPGSPIPSSAVPGAAKDENEWFGYVTMRDGTKLSVNVRLPGPPEDGPYPTVVEYSGYGPSDPTHTEPGSLIAGLLGFATVGVNMRGTGCSGGAFDVFNAAQQADGYDMIEAIARQPWVKGHKVGMVGLSYSGITQLYVAATRPPSLAAITPLSVIKDPWLEQWQGGVYNAGFTKNWLRERDAQSSSNGTSWVGEQTKVDTTCKANQRIREQNVDFESFGRSLERRPELSNARDLSYLVPKIQVPVFLTGAWQDEQTGPQFADMLDRFTGTKLKRFTMFNGRHPDGYSPLTLTRWWEFLELFVDQQVPKLSDGLRAAAPGYINDAFGSKGLGFEPDRFAKLTADQYDEAVAQWRAEPQVRVLFESGAGDDVPGNPVPTAGADFSSWPPKGTEARSFYLQGTSLVTTPPTGSGTGSFANDPASGKVDFCNDVGDSCGLLSRTWDFDWQPFPKGKALSYVTTPFARDQVLGGPGYVDLRMRVPDGDADVQASLSVIRPDGTEWKVTTGLLRLSDRKVDEDRSRGLQVERTYSEADAEPMPKGEFATARVALPSFAQPVRAGDRLRLVVSSPGRDFAAWLFETIGKPGAKREVAWGGAEPSKLVVGELPGVGELPAVDPACPSLRGQPCRPYAGS